MRDFVWNHFSRTGDVESFLLYREMDQISAAEDESAAALADPDSLDHWEEDAY